MAPAMDQPSMSAREAATINAAAVTRNYSVKPRLRYQTVSAVSGKAPRLSQAIDTCKLTLMIGPLIILDNVKVSFLPCYIVLLSNDL
jgi:hypothetical protein